MNIVPASQNSFAAAIRLLDHNKLPTADIGDETKLFVMEDGNKVIGTVAIEYDNESALLRSLTVEDNYRNKGIGEALVSFIEDYVRRLGIKTVYILTTTASKFFAKRKYEVITREEVPSFIRSTSEFDTLCPASATVMKKQII